MQILGEEARDYARPVTFARSRLDSLVEDAPPALVGFAPVAGLAFRNGGFFATSWGWWAIAALLAAAVVLAAGRAVALGRRQAVALCLLAAFVGWTALSALWATGATTPLVEAE